MGKVFGKKTIHFFRVLRGDEIEYFLAFIKYRTSGKKSRRKLERMVEVLSSNENLLVRDTEEEINKDIREIYRKVYEEEASLSLESQKKKIRDLLNPLGKELKLFFQCQFINQKQRTEIAIRPPILWDALKDRGLDYWQAEAKEKSFFDRKSYPLEDDQWFLDQYYLKLYELEKQESSSQQMKNAVNRNVTNFLDTHELDQFFCLQKLRAAVMVFDRLLILGGNLSSDEKTKIANEWAPFIEYAKSISSRFHPLLKVYWLILSKVYPNLRVKGDIELAFKEEDLWTVSPINYLAEISGYLINYFQRNYLTESDVKQKKQDLTKLKGIYEIFIQKVGIGHITDLSSMQMMLFKNYISICLRENELKTAIDFIQTNEDFLNKEILEVAKYCWAQIKFEERLLGDAKKYLQQIDEKNQFFSIGADILRCKIEFIELKEMFYQKRTQRELWNTSMEYQDKFKSLIFNAEKKIKYQSGLHKQKFKKNLKKNFTSNRYLNFYKYFRELARTLVKDKNHISSSELHQKLIQSEEEIIEMEWLINEAKNLG